MLKVVINYPRLYTTYSSRVAEVFSLQFLVAAVPFECLYKSKKGHYYNELIAKTAGPIGVIALGAVLYVAMKHGLRLQCTDTAQFQKRKNQLSEKFTRAFFLITYVVYVPSRCVCPFVLFKIPIQITEYFQCVTGR